MSASVVGRVWPRMTGSAAGIADLEARLAALLPVGWPTAHPSAPVALGCSQGRLLPLTGGRWARVGGETGSGSSSVLSDRIDILDPATWTWSAGPRLPQARSACALIPLPGGGGLIVGGILPAGWTNTCYRLSADGQTLTQIASLNTTRGVPAVALCLKHGVLAGKVVVLGGWNGSRLYSYEVWDPDADTWTAAACDYCYFRGAAIELPDGRVLVTGGWDAPQQAHYWDPYLNSWAGAPTLPVASDSHCLVDIPALGGALLLSESFTPSAMWIWDYAGSRWGSAIGYRTLGLRGVYCGAAGNSVVTVGGFLSSNNDTVSQVQSYRFG